MTACAPTLDYDSPIRRLTKPGEQLLWVGRPRQGVSLWSLDPGVLVLIWALVSAGWAYRLAVWAAGLAGIGNGGPPPSVFHHGAILAGWCYLAYRATVLRRRRGATWYGVTDRRVIFLLSKPPVPSVISIDYAEIANAELAPQAGGYGTILLRLRRDDPYVGLSDVLGSHTAPHTPVLESVPAPREVLKLIREACAALAKPRRDCRPPRGNSSSGVE